MDDEYAELVLSVVEQIPPGQVATYGDIAEIVGRGGPRQVGHVMALLGGGVPWWRVVRADGRPARSLEEPGLKLLRAVSELTAVAAEIRRPAVIRNSCRHDSGQGSHCAVIYDRLGTAVASLCGQCYAPRTLRGREESPGVRQQSGP